MGREKHSTQLHKVQPNQMRALKSYSLDYIPSWGIYSLFSWSESFAVFTTQCLIHQVGIIIIATPESCCGYEMSYTYNALGIVPITQEVFN